MAACGGLSEHMDSGAATAAEDEQVGHDTHLSRGQTMDVAWAAAGRERSRCGLAEEVDEHKCVVRLAA